MSSTSRVEFVDSSRPARLRDPRLLGCAHLPWTCSQPHCSITRIERVALILLSLALMLRDLLARLPPSVSTPSDEWFTLPQIAEMLDVNPSTVRHWVSIGRLSAEKRGPAMGRGTPRPR